MSSHIEPGPLPPPPLQHTTLPSQNYHTCNVPSPPPLQHTPPPSQNYHTCNVRSPPPLQHTAPPSQNYHTCNVPPPPPLPHIAPPSHVVSVLLQSHPKTVSTLPPPPISLPLTMAPPTMAPLIPRTMTSPPAPRHTIPQESSEPTLQECNNSASQLLAEKAYCQVLQDESRWSMQEEQVSVQNYSYLSVYQPVTPIIQSGPTCGLVGLVMAAERLGVKVTCEEVIRQATESRFTLHGEMFSAANMASLCETILPCSAVVIHPQEDYRLFLISLLQGQPVLFPYDADRNHQPCLKWGHKAHWAVLTGAFVKIRTTLIEETDQTDNAGDMSHLSIYPSLTEDVINLIAEHERRNDSSVTLWAYGHQGKSRHPGIWPIDKLMESNNNLVEIDPDKSVNPTSWIVPEGGLIEGLKNQAIVLKDRT